MTHSTHSILSDDDLCTVAPAIPSKKGFTIPSPTAYRAAIFKTADGQSIAMTGLEDSGEADDALMSIAIATAAVANICGDWPGVPMDEFRDRLVIGEWSE